MAKFQLQYASTSQSILIFIQNSTSTTGAGLTGLVYNTSGLTAYYAYARLGDGPFTLVTLATITTAYTAGGFKEVDATNMPGWYRLDVPDAIISGTKSGGQRCLCMHLQGAASMAPCPIEIELTGWDTQDGIHGGLTSLPAVAAGAVGGLPLAVDTSGRVDVLKINGTSQTARDLGASVLLSPGTGGGQVDITAGVIKTNLVQILGTALTETAGQIAAAFKMLFNVAAPTLTCLSINQTGDNYPRLGAPAGASHAADVAAIKSDTTTLTTRIPGTVAAQTGDSFARLGAPAGASHAADVAAVKADTTTLTTRIPGTVAAQTGDSFARIGAPAGASVSADVAAVKTDTALLITGVATVITNLASIVASTAAAVWSAVTRTLTSAPVDPNVALIKAKTDNLPAAPAAVSDIPTAVQNATALLTVDLMAISGEASRSPLNALRFLRNKWEIQGGVLTIYKEDDTTPAWTGAVTTAPGAEPVTGNDPA